MTVEIPSDIPQLDEARQGTLDGRFDLARVLPKLGRDPRESHRGVDFLLGGAGYSTPARLPEGAVLGELRPFFMAISRILILCGLEPVK